MHQLVGDLVVRDATTNPKAIPGARAPCAPGAENSCTSSSATSLYVVRPLPSTFWHTFMLKWRRPLPPCRPPPLPRPPLSPAPALPPRDVPLAQVNKLHA